MEWEYRDGGSSLLEEGEAGFNLKICWLDLLASVLCPFG